MIIELLDCQKRRRRDEHRGVEGRHCQHSEYNAEIAGLRRLVAAVLTTDFQVEAGTRRQFCGV